MPTPVPASGGILVGAVADRPVAATSNAGVVYITTDAAKAIVSRSTGGAWVDLTPALLLQGYSEKVNALGNTGATPTVDLTLGNVVTATSDQAAAWTFSNPAGAGYCSSLTLRLTNGGAFAQTWPADVDWPGGSAPALTAAGKDVLTFFRPDNTIWHGTLAQADTK